MLVAHTYAWPIRQYLSMMNNAKFEFEILIQRKGKLWTAAKKVKLIEKMMKGIKVFPVTSYKKGDVYYIIDGRQRLEGAIFPFLNNEFKLSDGRTFSDYSEDEQKQFLKYSLTIVQYDGCITPEEIIEVFECVNSGEPLTPTERIRALIGFDNLKIFTQLSEHPFISNKTSITSNRYNNLNAILQIMVLLENPDNGLGSRVLEKFARDHYESGITDNMKTTIQDVLDYMNSGIEKKHKFMGKTAFPMCFMMARLAKEKGIDADTFGKWIVGFYGNLQKGDVYYDASQGGNAKRTNVKIRLEVLTQTFNRHFNQQMDEQ